MLIKYLSVFIIRDGLEAVSSFHIKVDWNMKLKSNEIHILRSKKYEADNLI